ncbi:hypothetical protein J1614_001540 [Plenodomus biglobosus]|nr:hypothetical protein J1614_001540 [Plenodomus biglobosus]
MEEFLRRARIPPDSELPVVKAEPSIARLSDVAPSSEAVTTEAPSVLGGATNLRKPTQVPGRKDRGQRTIPDRPCRKPLQRRPRPEVICRPLTGTIRVIPANDNSSFTQVNPSVAKHINQRHAHPWKGPLLAIALQGTASNSELPLWDDVSIEDLRHVFDFLNTYSSTTLSTEFDCYLGRTVRGVKINSSGDQASAELPDVFEAVRVPTTHSVFHQTSSRALPIADQIGLQVHYAKCPRKTDHEAVHGIETSGMRKSNWNSPFRDLIRPWLLNCQEDFAAAAFIRVGVDDMVTEYYSGSAILVRQDEKPLHVKQMEALWRYNKYLLELKMARLSRAVASRGSSDEAGQHMVVVTEYLCKAWFVQFYADGQCHQKTAAERAVLSPYEMRKRLGSLKRKSSPDFFACGSKKSKWEWTSDCDEESGGEQQASEAGETCARKN